MEMKRCVHCGQLKPVTEFSKNSYAKDGLQSWCKQCTNEYKKTTKRTPLNNQTRINLEPFRKDILIYRKTHTIQQTADWITSHYGIKCGETTVSTWLMRWKDNNDMEHPDTGIKFKPFALADLPDTDLITELRKRGYRVYYERFIKSKWGNHYKKRMVEAVGNTDNK